MSANEQQVELRDLQGLLRENLDKDLVVVDYRTSMLLPKGENYGSTMLKVDARVKKTKDSPEEEMHFVAKMVPTHEFSKMHMRMTASFNKEIFIVHKLREMYRELERKAGVREEDLIDIFPKFYGGRLSKSVESPDVVDEDAVMLLENLKVRGYETMNRFHGMDFDHMHWTIKEYARFHALGTALRMKNPEFWKLAREPINKMAFDLPDNEFDDVSKHTVELLCSDPRMNEYSDRINRAFSAGKNFESLKNTEEIEPWISIVHGDGWVNNLLYHHDKNGKVDDVKIVDYQIARTCSPLKDLPYFLCASGSMDIIDNHFDELLDIYYDKYVEVLARIGCDVSAFTKESFHKQLDKDGQDELFHCILVLKIITTEVSQEMDIGDMKSSLLLTDSNQVFMDRSWRIVSKFVEKGWI
ncbi:uncharacterized protein LOC116416639 [Nasonia vitripennis]|uniref:CHK kinase-like domain-containing protein n=1 Tax=Nasonia vitripennis TaxID=7425 RepID=A0A7M7Q4H9_NASVI|nr:uncharacterized protein LOC116416639 [Nasonia vitripennis]